MCVIKEYIGREDTWKDTQKQITAFDPEKGIYRLTDAEKGRLPFHPIPFVPCEVCAYITFEISTLYTYIYLKIYDSMFMFLRHGPISLPLSI